MHRRTYLQRLLGALGISALGPWKLFGQSDPFNPEERQVLLAVALVVLPSALGKPGVERVVTGFESYVRGYRAGADTDHGYGFTHVVPKPPSPAATYKKQLAELRLPITREAVEQALQAAAVKDLPRVPAGTSVICDLMTFYFRSSEANDLCYGAAIGRDQCRGLAGSDRAPAPLRGSAA